MELTLLPGFTSAFRSCFQLAFASSHPDWTRSTAVLLWRQVPSLALLLASDGRRGSKWRSGPSWQGEGQGRPFAIFLINLPLRRGAA